MRYGVTNKRRISSKEEMVNYIINHLYDKGKQAMFILELMVGENAMELDNKALMAKELSGYKFNFIKQCYQFVKNNYITFVKVKL